MPRRSAGARRCTAESIRSTYVQDIRSLELYGTVGAAVCCLDGLNYLCGRGDLDRCLGALANYLEPGGVFIFDVNTPHKFRDIYGTRDYVIEDEGVLCAWENDYNEKDGNMRFLSLCILGRENGLWERSDEVQRERCYTRRVLENALARNGFAVCEVLERTVMLPQLMRMSGGYS